MMLTTGDTTPAVSPVPACPRAGTHQRIGNDGTARPAAAQSNMRIEQLPLAGFADAEEAHLAARAFEGSSHWFGRTPKKLWRLVGCSWFPCCILRGRPPCARGFG